MANAAEPTGSKGASGALSLFSDLYKQLPGPAKVVAFFLVLVFALFLLASPKTIGGSVKYLDSKNKERGYAGKTIRVFVQSNYFAYQTQNRGEFILPVTNPFGGTSFRVENPNDPETEITGEIGFGDIWSSYLGGKPVEIKLDFEKGAAAVVVEAPGFPGSFLSPSGAWAETLVLPPSIAQQTLPGKFDLVAVRGAVSAIVADYTGLSAPSLASGLDLSGTKVSDLDWISIFDEIMTQYDVDFPLESRKSFATTESLAQYVVAQKKIQAYLVARKVSPPSSLYETLKLVPKDQRVTVER